MSGFKEKALGQDLTEFENSLRDKISESLHQLKQEFVSYCQNKAKTYLEKDVERLNKNLQAGMYGTLEAALVDIEQIKVSFNKLGPKFNGSQLILTETCSQLVVKAAIYLMVLSRQETNVILRKT